MRQRFLRFSLVWGLAWIFWIPGGAAGATTGSDGALEDPRLEEKIREFSEELNRKVFEVLRELLDQEIRRLKQKPGELDEKTRRQLEKHRRSIQNHPQEADAFFELAKIYDRLGDGANAIIHMKQAERLYGEQNDVRGLARARRALRKFYDRYEFQPEDFELPG